MEKIDSNTFPLVSVIMATYNEPVAFITKSIQSILNQTYENFELIIADDSTNDSTIQAINVLANSDRRIILIRKEKRMGFVNALNDAINVSKGILLARMDGDDIALPCRLEKQVAYAISHPEIDIFGGSMFIIDKKDTIISERSYPTSPFRLKLMFAFRNPMAHPTIMFRRKIIDAGFLYDPNYKKAEDLDLYFRLYKNGFKLGNMSDKLIKYRTVGNLQKKRTDENWKYNHKTRKENFIFRKPIFSICSVLASSIYEYVPKKIVSFFYSNENNKKKLNNNKRH